MPTIGAVKAGESLSEIAAAAVLLDHGDGVQSKGTVDLLHPLNPSRTDAPISNP